MVAGGCCGLIVDDVSFGVRISGIPRYILDLHEDHVEAGFAFIADR